MIMETQGAATIGAPVYRRGEIGHVTAIQDSAPGVFSIGAGGLSRSAHDIEVCFVSHLDTLPLSIVAPWLESAARMGLPAISADEAAMKAANARANMGSARDLAKAVADAQAERAAAFRDEAAAKIPPWAKAVIVAEHHQDDSDSMTDYFAHKTTRRVILAWSPHTRDLFPELRKAALNFADTVPLASAPEKAEHREKYSMGAGFYLKDGWSNSTGWAIKKVRFYSEGGDRAQRVPVGEWALPVDEAVTREATAPAVHGAADGFTLSEHMHERKGFRMWIATGPRVEREEYDRLLIAAKALGGWYSRPWNGTPGGFAFKDEAKARQFIGDAPPPVQVTTAATLATTSPRLADRLRDLADAMQGEIDHKFGDRQTNTPKRQREAQSARLDGYRLQRTQQGLRALADHHDAGTVPAVLAMVKTKAAAFDLARGEITTSGGYYDAGIETGKPAKETPAALAFWALLSSPSDADRKADELRRKVEALQFANIPGYFPTPAPIIARMFEAANIPAGQHVDILEPSAGSGAILDQARFRYPFAILSSYERHASLRAILTAKGYTLAGADFTEETAAPGFDYVLMNPPFEKGQDIDHVRHAFAFLRPGGRLVAIMSPGPFFRQDRKAADFREWFEGLGGERQEIEAGAFKESGTGVASCMVVIDR